MKETNAKVSVEKYYGKEWAVSVKIGNQSFYVYSAGDKKSDALWMAKMLRIALKKLTTKQWKKLTTKKLKRRG